MTSSTSNTNQPNSSPSYEIHDNLIHTQLKFSISNIKNLITTQLTTDNYPLWHSQILKIFKANNYADHLDGSSPCPAEHILQFDGISNLNPTYTTWKLIDQHLAASLYSIISTPLLPYVIHLNTCTKIWQTLERRLQAANRSCILQIKNELHNITMKDQSITQYLSTIKAKVDSITVVSATIDIEANILYTLNGLPSSY